MRNLLIEPAWRAEDLGLPLPVDPHAVSVALPLWEHVIGYEENDPRVVDKLQLGYPRFVLHPLVRHLAAEAERDLAVPGETAWLYASRQAAQRAAQFAGSARVEAWRAGLHAALTPEASWQRGKLAWRFFGEGISSRRAEAVLEGKPLREDLAAAAVRQIRSDLARRSGQEPADVFLFPSGMAAMAAAHRVVRRLRPAKPSVQLGFPYVDVLKVQQECPAGVLMLDAGDQPALEAMDPHSVSGVFTEIVSNPQLRTPPLPWLASRLRAAGVPLVVDDTLATSANVDVYPYADLVTTSLTKYYSGAGNVMAGSLLLQRTSPLYADLRTALEEDYADDFFAEDAQILAENARDFDSRIDRINRNAEAVVSYLSRHPKVEVCWYPQHSSRSEYDAIRRAGGGYGGLLTFLVACPARNALPLYDHLEISKGPSLGTNFSLVCPYMLLAHYNELGWTDRLGMDRHLLRFSVGLEPHDVLIERLDRAFRACPA